MKSDQLEKYNTQRNLYSEEFLYFCEVIFKRGNVERGDICTYIYSLQLSVVVGPLRWCRWWLIFVWFFNICISI